MQRVAIERPPVLTHATSSIGMICAIDCRPGRSRAHPTNLEDRRSVSISALGWNRTSDTRFRKPIRRCRHTWISGQKRIHINGFDLSSSRAVSYCFSSYRGPDADQNRDLPTLNGIVLCYAKHPHLDLALWDGFGCRVEGRMRGFRVRFRRWVTLDVVGMRWSDGHFKLANRDVLVAISWATLSRAWNCGATGPVSTGGQSQQ